MSVYTSVTHLQLNVFLSNYQLGTILTFDGIKDGIDNTNYYVTTTNGDFVLTIFETLCQDDLGHLIKLLLFLNDSNLPCPRLKLNKNSNTLGLLNNKLAAIFNKLPGCAILKTSIKHCQEIGLYLGMLHCYTQDYNFPIKSKHDLNWCRKIFDKIESNLTAIDCDLIKDELQFQTDNYLPSLPRGVIHGDLFRDNVLFVDEKLTGLLDFYSASNGFLIMDIAITVNDSCQDNGLLIVENFLALLASYETVRPLEPLEKKNLHVQLRAAALRFWLSRMDHKFHPRIGEITHKKDPLIFRKLLCQYRQNIATNSVINS